MTMTEIVLMFWAVIATGLYMNTSLKKKMLIDLVKLLLREPKAYEQMRKSHQERFGANG